MTIEKYIKSKTINYQSNLELLFNFYTSQIFFYITLTTTGRCPRKFMHKKIHPCLLIVAVFALNTSTYKYTQR